MKRLICFVCLWVSAGGGILPAVTAIAQDRKNGPPTGILSDIGRWFEQSLNSIGAQFKANDAQVNNDEAGIAAKSAADGAIDASDIARIPITRIVNGHQTCPISENGAPDCNTAAEKLCNAKGLKSGASLEITVARDCPTRALLQKDARSECKDVTFITRALCQ
jgi:hypothetical protein